ncbi:MAG TPA: hypothetical protein GX501_03340, partial [Clostridiaceae bacterium]|nr:hypothetical protein [Clostridiaceae bacterium]
MRSAKKAVIAAMVLAIALSSVYGSGSMLFADTYAPGQTDEKGLYSGIVRESNPSLGYITLYFEDGSGYDPYRFAELVSLRTFTYGYDMIVTRDGYPAVIDDIKPGDKAYLKLDEEGYIYKISAASYYTPVYGTVYAKRASGLVLKKDDGTYVNYTVPGSVPVYKNNKPFSFSGILPGDRVRIMVQTNGANIDIEAIDIESITRNVSGIFRGTVEYFDSLHYSLAISEVQEFVIGRWENTSTAGIQRFDYSDEYRPLLPKRLSGTVYIATKKAYDGKDKIVFSSFRNTSGYETTLRDNLLNITGSNVLVLENTPEIVNVDMNTIVVKDGRLVDVSALNTLDPLKISMEKDLYKNRYTANVLVSDSAVQSGLIVYRGRIKSVAPQKSLTVESFAQLGGVSWSVTNTPKTFDIDLFAGRLLEDDGIGNLRGIGSEYVNRSVYIVAEGTKIRLISTAPY